MRFLILTMLFFAVLFGAGCATTSRVIADTRSPDIVIDRFGDVAFQGRRVSPDEDIAKVVSSAGIPKKTKIRILVPENCDRELMGLISGRLIYKGYSTLFVTNRMATVEDSSAQTPTP